MTGRRSCRHLEREMPPGMPSSRPRPLLHLVDCRPAVEARDEEVVPGPGFQQAKEFGDWRCARKDELVYTVSIVRPSNPNADGVPQDQELECAVEVWIQRCSWEAEL